MIETVIAHPQSQWKWVDVFSPTPEDIHQLTLEYGLHATSLEDCLDPEHLPKFERIKEMTFLIVRHYDETSLPEGDTVQELTRKIAIFWTPQFLLTIHRLDSSLTARLRGRWRMSPLPPSLEPIVYDILQTVFSSYAKPLEVASDRFYQLEDDIVRCSRLTGTNESMYYLKRQCSVYRRILKISLDQILVKLGNQGSLSSPLLQDAREEAEHYYFFADEMVDSCQHLLNLSISLASHRASEVMRVLTIFSVFFMPLTFIVGVYGMNFHHMPELARKHGYMTVWGLMATVTIAIFIWFRRRDWL